MANASNLPGTFPNQGFLIWHRQQATLTSSGAFTSSKMRGHPEADEDSDGSNGQEAVITIIASPGSQRGSVATEPTDRTPDAECLSLSIIEDTHAEERPKSASILPCLKPSTIYDPVKLRTPPNLILSSEFRQNTCATERDLASLSEGLHPDYPATTRRNEGTYVPEQTSPPVTNMPKISASEPAATLPSSKFKSKARRRISIRSEPSDAESRKRRAHGKSL